MLPVVAGDLPAKRQSLLYAALTVAASLVPFFTRAESAVYLVGASVLGLGLLALCWLDLKERGWTARLFRYSLLYLAALFLLLGIGVFGP
jgi:heme O synthase-like polyprenyltransferase